MLIPRYMCFRMAKTPKEMLMLLKTMLLLVIIVFKKSLTNRNINGHSILMEYQLKFAKQMGDLLLNNIC